MKQILILFYDNYECPSQILSYSLLNENGEVSTHNVEDRSNSPYWRFSHGNVEDVLGQDLFIYDKKSLYKYSDQRYPNLIDVNSSLFHFGKTPLTFIHDENSPINSIINQIRDGIGFDFLKPISGKYNDLIRAEAILDGRVIINDEVVKKTYDHYTLGLRLRDTTGQTLSMKKSIRETIKTMGVLIEFDMESFHIRILDTLIKSGIPNDVRAHDYIVDQAELYGDDNKKRIFSAMYSENFNTIDCEFFRLLGTKYKRIKSPFGRDHDNFSHKVQEYESYLMSKYIQKIDVEYVDIILYLYDGLYMDLKDPSRVEEYVNLIKEKINLPFTIKIGTFEQRFYH